MTGQSPDGSEPETVIAIYRAKRGSEDALLEVLRGHWPVLRRAGLVTDARPTVYVGCEQDGGPIVFEIFTWVDGRAAHTAHETPDVMRVWEAIGELCEERDGRPKFLFPHVRPVELALQGI